MTNKTPKKSAVSLKNERKVFLDDCEHTYVGKIVNMKKLDEFTEDDQISFTSDAMFKTMLCNSERKKYACKLLSGLLEKPFDYIMENSEYYRNELDKDTVDAKNERGDLVLKIDDDYVVVEMNMTDETGRNIEYTDRIYRATIKVGEKYIYPSILGIFFCNYSYSMYQDDIMHTFHLQTDDGICLVKKTYVQIYLPILMKKWYTLGTKNLSDFEKTVLAMASTERSKTKELVKDDETMKEYFDEAKKVEQNDNYLREAYDHQVSEIRAAKEAAFEEASIKKAEEIKAIKEEAAQEIRAAKEAASIKTAEEVRAAREEGRSEIIRTLHSKNMTSKEIHDLTEIPLEEIENIISKLSK